MKTFLMKNKNYMLWFAFLIAIFISAYSCANEVATPDNVDNPDTNPPTLTISTNSTLGKDTPGKIIFFFNEDVYDFTTNDINLSGFNVDKVKFITNSKKEYTWVMIPKESGTLNINIPIGSFKDDADNFNTSIISNSFKVEEDITPPAVSITGVYFAENIEGKIIFYFDEDVTNFTKSDIKFANPSPTTGEFIINNQKSYELVVTPIAAGSLTVTIDAGSLEDLSGNPNQAVSVDLNVDDYATKVGLKEIIEVGEIPTSRSILKNTAKDVLSYYSGTSEVIAKYAKTDGTGDGSSWAKSTNDVKATINGILDANNSKIYLILVASGEYPSTNIAMKNHVAIIGGWSPNTEWERAGETRFDGQGSNRVFYNYQNNLNRTALLYGATIANGKATDNGGGMYNDNSSPSLRNVTFSGNKASYVGDGLGGGMYNYKSSSPILVNVTFSGNKADISGGGMYNYKSSSPILVNVTFSGNKADISGGGMYNYKSSSPSLVNVTFSGNTAGIKGGGMYVEDTSSSATFLVNTIFWGNQAKGSPNQISFKNSIDKLSLHYSIIQGGTSSLGGTLTNSHITEGDPLLSPLADNGGFIKTHVLEGGSPAIDAGVYAKKSEKTLYFSTSKISWYTNFNNQGFSGAVTRVENLPPNTEDITTTDARGYIRTDRPDIGAYENGGIAPAAD